MLEIKEYFYAQLFIVTKHNSFRFLIPMNCKYVKFTIWHLFFSYKLCLFEMPKEK